MYIQSLPSKVVGINTSILFQLTKQAIVEAWGWGHNYLAYTSHCERVGAPIATQSSYEKQCKVLDSDLTEFKDSVYQVLTNGQY